MDYCLNGNKKWLNKKVREGGRTQRNQRGKSQEFELHRSGSGSSKAKQRSIPSLYQTFQVNVIQFPAKINWSPVVDFNLK